VLESRGAQAMAELFIVAAVSFAVGDEVAVTVAPATGEKCPRCWNLRELGTDARHPEVCGRCSDVLEVLGA